MGRMAELRLRLAKLREHRTRLLATLALEGDGPNSAVGVLRERLLAHANSRIHRIERALRAVGLSGYNPAGVLASRPLVDPDTFGNQPAVRPLMHCDRHAGPEWNVSDCDLWRHNDP
jgi:hypothetical protein